MRTANTYQKSRRQQSHRKQSKHNSPDKRQEHDYVQAEEKLETAKQTIASMRKSYLKDINQLRNQMWLNDKYQHLNLLKQSNKNKNREDVYIDVQFFDKTAGLDPVVTEALNSKLEMMRYQYDKSLMQLQDYNIKL